MSYTKNNWSIYNPELPDEQQEDAFITKAKLENIENGIEAAHNLIENAEGIVGKDGKDGVDGKDGKDGVNGKDGYTPIKGTDYFTEEDKLEIRDEVIATRKTTPYFNEEANVVAACGVHINVDTAEEAGKLRIHWFDNERGEAEELIVPEGVKIAGGGVSDNVVEYYPATSVTLNSGYVDMIIGGCYGNGNVGCATIIVNGGTFKQGVAGGGMHWGVKNAYTNKVGVSEVIINNTENEATLVFASNSSGVCSVGHARMTINGGYINYLTAGGSNGHTSIAELIVNGGTIKVLQGCNRGLVDNIKITINGGTINKLFAGGESGDATVDATYTKCELFINGGNLSSISAGTNSGVENADKVSGTYVNGVIADDMAAALHLVKVVSVEQMLQRIIDLELAKAAE